MSSSLVQNYENSCFLIKSGIARPVFKPWPRPELEFFRWGKLQVSTWTWFNAAQFSELNIDPDAWILEEPVLSIAVSSQAQAR